MADVPMPAWMRRIQQGYLWQKVVLPTAVGFGGSLVLQGCLTKGLQNIETVCALAAMNATVLTWITAWLQGHSPGSASFKIDGTPIEAAPKLKELADNAIMVQTKADDPNIPEVTQADANKAVNALDQASVAVAMQNQIVKTALENEEKQ